MHEIVTLLNELLPPLPEGTISLPSNYSLCSKRPAKNHVPDNNTGEDINGTMGEISTREKLLRDQPELLVQFGIDFFSSPSPGLWLKCEHSYSTQHY